MEKVMEFQKPKEYEPCTRKTDFSSFCPLTVLSFQLGLWVFSLAFTSISSNFHIQDRRCLGSDIFNISSWKGVVLNESHLCGRISHYQFPLTVFIRKGF